MDQLIVLVQSHHTLQDNIKIGSVQNDQAAAEQARLQALKSTASADVVANRSYQDLFA